MLRTAICELIKNTNLTVQPTVGENITIIRMNCVLRKASTNIHDESAPVYNLYSGYQQVIQLYNTDVNQSGIMPTYNYSAILMVTED